jgi:DNA polymerase-3 subunit gamma/tau
MSHEALARKWRPKKFDEVIGQRGVVETLRNAIASGRLAQSFIFAGPRGVGKTTTARLLARALNCEHGPTADPCGTCDACVEIARGSDIDVLEIDGATYTGVDAIREVIVEPLAMSPMRDRYKIFIIDEVHRLSKHAFDALLKSIEEPPKYVTFMMATTDPQNIPDTIKSRSQVFELKALSFSAIRDQLRALMTNEGIEIDDAALGLVARAAEGSMRDALSALDQVLAFSSDKVTSADVSSVLGLIGRDVQFDIVETVAREDLSSAFTLAGTVVDSGFELRVVCRELARLMRDVLVVQIDPTRLADPEVASEGERPRLQALARQYSREDLMRSFDLLSKSEYEIRQSSQPRHTFEMMLVKWIHLRQLTPLTDVIAAVEHGRGLPAAPAGAPAMRGAAPATRPGLPAAAPAATLPPRPAMPPRVPAPPAPASRPAAGPSRPAVQTAPPPAASQPSRPVAPPAPAGDPKAALLAAIREQNKAFYGIVVAQAQKVEIENDTVVFTFAAVHKSLKTQLDAKRGWVEQLAQAAAGRHLAVVTRELPPVAAVAAADVGAAESKRADLEARAKAQPTVQAVLDVFGGEIEDIEEIK